MKHNKLKKNKYKNITQYIIKRIQQTFINVNNAKKNIKCFITIYNIKIIVNHNNE
jgi:hypothetical protein